MLSWIYRLIGHRVIFFMKFIKNKIFITFALSVLFCFAFLAWYINFIIWYISNTISNQCGILKLSCKRTKNKTIKSNVQFILVCAIIYKWKSKFTNIGWYFYHEHNQITIIINRHFGIVLFYLYFPPQFSVSCSYRLCVKVHAIILSTWKHKINVSA